MLDGFAAIFLSASLGWGVGASIVTILVLQGGLTLGASSIASVMTPEIVASLGAVGGLVIATIGLKLLDIKDLKPANFIPALLLAPLFTWAVAAWL